MSTFWFICGFRHLKIPFYQHKNVSFISYNGQCTNDTWAMYEWYMANVRLVHVQCTKLILPFRTP